MGNDWEVATDYTQSPYSIWICWKPQQVEVQTLISRPQFVHFLVKDKRSPFASQITFVYGLNTINERKVLWKRLRTLNNSTTDPWIVLGDFNVVLSVNDRQNGVPVHPTEIKDFQECIEELGLRQLKRT